METSLRHGTEIRKDNGIGATTAASYGVSDHEFLSPGDVQHWSIVRVYRELGELRCGAE